MAKISSVQNLRVKTAARLRERSGRDQQRRIIIDGAREIERALASGVTVLEGFFSVEFCRAEEHQRLLATAEKAGAELIEVTPHVMEKLSFGQRVEGVVAVARPPQRRLDDLALNDDTLVAIVEGAEKPGNLGAIVRTADAAGVGTVIVADGGTDLYNPNAIRASLGAIFSVPVVAVSTEAAIVWLRERQFRVYAARVDGVTEYTDVDFLGRVAIALGSEARGLSARWRGDNIKSIRLPLLGSVDSLNLSVTAAVIFYEVLRQRRLSST
jgi:TrmH family RNA methyltransferase